MRRIPWFAGVAVLSLVAGIAARQWWGYASLPKPSPNLWLEDVQDHIHVVPGEWRGKVLIVNFWATWCEPCREEMPEFVRMQNELGGRGLQFVGIALDEAEAVEDFLAGTPVNYPILLGDMAAGEWAEALGNPLSVLPFSVVFDRTGSKVFSRIGVFRPGEILAVTTDPLNSPIPPK